MFSYQLTADDGVKPERIGETRPAFIVRRAGETQVEICVFLSPTDAHGDREAFFRLVDVPPPAAFAPAGDAAPDPAI